MENNTNDINSTQDFEMGPSEQPKINVYNQNQPAANTQTPEVNPTATAPTSTEFDKTEQTQQTQPAQNQGIHIAQAKNPVTPPNKPIKDNSAAKKKALMILLAVGGGFLILFLILAFFFIASSDGNASPLADLLGVNQALFVNGLITFIHIIFFLISLFFFVMTMVGIFRASMAKKDDRETKKKGLKASMIAGLLLFFVVISWGFSYVYLDSKRIITGPDVVAPDIKTDPEEPLNLTAPIEVRFDAGNIKVDSNKYQIVSHEWDFGDGKKGTSQIVSHRYEEKGTYDVKLVINVRDKKTGEVSVGGEFHTTVSVTNQKLSAIFEVDKQEGEAPLVVNFDAGKSVDPDGYLDTFEWDLDGDGQFDDAKGTTITHTFEKIGKYNVSLRVVSTTGEFDITEKEIIVKESLNPEPVITIINEPQKFLVGTNYAFQADESTSPNGKIVKYEWDFGDGSRKETTKSASHSFKAPGTYVVTLKVTDEANKEAEVKKTISIGNLSSIPKANITTVPSTNSGTLTGIAPFSVTFDASGSTDADNNIIEYRWDFNGDGTSDDYGQRVTHTFSEPGTYNINLKVTDTDENIGSATLTVVAEAQGIKAKIDANQVDGSVPLIVEFDASGSTYQNGQITSYRWDFGDGTPAVLGAAKMTHRYSSIGTYTATLTAIGSNNKTATDQITITVREIPLAACFTSVFTEGAAPLQTVFDPSCSKGTIAKYFWDFGDGLTSTQVKPNHTFESAGQYTVKLEVADNGNNISTHQINITVR